LTQSSWSEVGAAENEGIDDAMTDVSVRDVSLSAASTVTSYSRRCCHGNGLLPQPRELETAPVNKVT